MPPFDRFLCLVTVACILVARAAGQEPTRSADFERDVQPILAQRCFECHSGVDPDGGVRLDRREDALAPGIVTPGNAAASELVARLTTANERERMPLGKPPLPDAEVRALAAWVAQGAEWPEALAEPGPHWAYVAPTRPEPPPVRDAPWVRNPIDAFVLARLEAEGLAPSPEADPATLARRLSLDLTGLPPTPAELDAFLAGGPNVSGAAARAVERLLAAPQHAEHMARRWLDLARYADTHGYEKDDRRTMWRWRDWVIDAYARDMPFDRFTVEQLAGDLLPDATLEQRVATGFHRNTMLNMEGGTDPEEFRAAAVVDRVNTTASVWLGTTMACAQCHDHKVDPFTQAEYFGLYAFLDQTADTGNVEAPTLSAPTPAQATDLARVRAAIAALEAELAGDDAEMDAGQRAWEERARAGLAPPIAWRVIAPRAAESRAGAPLRILDDGSVLAGGEPAERDAYTLEFEVGAGALTGLRLEALAHPDLPLGGSGRAANANFVLSELTAELEQGGARRALAFAGARADFEQPGFRVPRAIDGNPDTGWAVQGRREDLQAAFALAEPVECADGAVLRVMLAHDSKHAQHLLGRFRLALTGDATLAARVLPARLGMWRSVGPFPAASGAEAYATAFEPEREYVQSGRFSAAYGDLAWRAHSEWREGDFFDLAEVPGSPGVVGATYLTRTVEAPDARFVALFTGSDDSIVVWLNGERVHASERLTQPGPAGMLRLRPGSNRLLVKVGNGGGAHKLFFELARSDAGGVPAGIEELLRKPPRARTLEDDRRVAAWIEAAAPADRLSPPVERALWLERAARPAAVAATLRAWYREHVSAPGRARHAQLVQLRGEREALEAAVPAALVLAAAAEPRETYVHVRGSFLEHGPRAFPIVPAVLGTPLAGREPGELGADSPDRLDLAHWLVAPDNPLTARVAVNRLWEQLFGQGLVRTLDDFGLRGDAPSHPELLDWLATEYVRRGWSTRAMLALIVDSATYRQSSRVTPELLARDFANRLLARGARFRLPAEAVRDVALATAGLLDRTVGGPSVFPYQPEGIWNATYSADSWKTAVGPDRYRRGLYTFWRRTAPYPTFALFDAPSREIACTRRERSNTPLQALAVLNDPAFVEAAGGLARRIVREAPAGVRERAAYAFRLCTAREPEPAELDVLAQLYRDQRAAFLVAPDEALALVRSAAPVGRAGRAGRAASVDPALPADAEGVIDLAAWTLVANALLNLDESLTRG